MGKAASCVHGDGENGSAPQRSCRLQQSTSIAIAITSYGRSNALLRVCQFIDQAVEDQEPHANHAIHVSQFYKDYGHVTAKSRGIGNISWNNAPLNKVEEQ